MAGVSTLLASKATHPPPLPANTSQCGERLHGDIGELGRDPTTNGEMVSSWPAEGE